MRYTVQTICIYGCFLIGAIFFPVSVFAQSPGGVSTDLQWWLKADAGVTGNPVTSWANQASGGGNATQGISSRSPSFQSDVINKNPILDFDGLNDFMTFDINSIKSSDYSVYVVGRRRKLAKYVIGGRNRTLNQALMFGYDLDNSAMFSQYLNNLSMAVANFDNPAITPFILFGDLNQSVGRVLLEFRDGVKTTTSNANTTPLSGTGTDYIGLSPNREYWNGGVSEIILYSDDLTTAEEQLVNSYLAIKYGMTLDHDYLDSSSTVLFDTDGTHSVYSNDIAGIGRDDTSGLNQLSSRSEHLDSVVSMSSASSQDNGDFLLWGNDDIDFIEINTSLPSGVAQRLKRIWRMKETGDVGTVTVSFDVTGLSVTGTTASDFILIQDTDTDFSSGAITTVASSFGSNVATFLGVDPGNGDYFALGTEASGGGGSLTVDIVDSGGSSVVSPTLVFPVNVFSFSSFNSSGNLGTSSERVRVTNASGTATWTLSIAASSPTDLFVGGNTGATYDFNDTSATVDGPDADSVPGRMRVFPSTATLVAEAGCSTTGISLGSTADFEEGVTDSITLASASSSADTGCYWEFTDIDIISSVPPEQPADTYSLDFTLSIIAS